jgi:restriction system protein
MGARRKQSTDTLDELFDLLLVIPWWAGPIVIAVCWSLFRFMAPAVFRAVGSSDNAVLAGMSKTLASISIAVSPYVALGVTAIWLIALVKKAMNSTRLESQTGIDSIRGLPWREFEALMAEAFRRQGYLVEDTGSGADGGIDLVLEKDGRTALVQCKQWRTKQVGVKPVRELLGVVASEQANKGIFVTSGRYTRDAVEFAKSNANLRLIDGAELEQLIRSVQRSEPSSGNKKQIKHKSVDQNGSPACPTCGAQMVRRVARRGANAGSEFFGCSKYPDCRGTRPIE